MPDRRRALLAPVRLTHCPLRNNLTSPFLRNAVRRCLFLAQRLSCRSSSLFCLWLVCSACVWFCQNVRRHQITD